MIKTLGDRIRELRQEQDISLRELAKKAGITAPFLSDIEQGKRFPSDEKMTSLSRALGTTIQDLAQYDSRPPLAEMKRLASKNPELGIAFRKIVDLPPEKLLEIARQHHKKEK